VITEPVVAAEPNLAIEVITEPVVAAEPTLAIEVITDPAVKESSRKSNCEPYRGLISNGLDQGRNAVGIYQDLVTDHGYGGGYASVMRMVRQMKGTRQPEAAGIIITAPGHEAQVDYGTGPMVLDKPGGKYRRTRLFVMTLGYSRKSVRLLRFKSSAKIWAQLHEESFRRLGGALRVVMLDNLKEGVLQPDFYDPDVNPLYRDVLKHYSCVALACRVRDPDRKGKVESGIGHAQKTPIQGKRFESLEAAQAYLDAWEIRWADTRIHGTTKRQVQAMFSEEKPHLLPLPAEPFRYYNYGTRTVQLNEHVEVDGSYYPVPTGRIGQLLSVQWDDRVVRILELGHRELLREHKKLVDKGQFGKSTEPRPQQTPPQVLALLDKADHSGRHIGAFCRALYQQDKLRSLGWIQGIRQLAKKHGASAVDAACAMAIENGISRYRFIRDYVERKNPPQLSLKLIDPLIRDLTEYRDIVNHLSQEKES
jgi:transposase